MSKLIIIRGNSGSGKSTVAKLLQHDMGYGTMLIPQDVVRREVLRTKDSFNNPSIHLIQSMALYGKDIGYDVIIEGILTGDKYGEMLVNLMGEFEEFYTYYFDIPFEETLRRHRLKSNKDDFGEKEMREWYVKHDVLGVKNEKVISESLSEEEILTSILLDLR